MTAQHPYGGMLTPEDSLERIQHGAGCIYDPQVVAALAAAVVPQLLIHGAGGVGVGVADVGQFDLVGGNLQVTGAPPGGEDGGPDAAGFNRFGGQEADPAYRQVVPVSCSSIASWNLRHSDPFASTSS